MIVATQNCLRNKHSKDVLIRWYRGVFPLIVVICLVQTGFSQSTLSNSLGDFSGSVSLTNNGISTIPNFTLGKPAAIFIMIAEKDGISFEPNIKFSTAGKPWSFRFSWHYDLLRKGKLSLDIGMHPVISFKSFSFSEGDAAIDVAEARRFLGGEFSSSYRISPKVKIGTYYLFSHGFDRNTPDRLHFFGLNAGLSRIKISSDLQLKYTSQVYYLNIDGSDGYFINMKGSISSPKLPISISSLINIAIDTNIGENQDPLWNVSLIYSFDLVD